MIYKRIKNGIKDNKPVYKIVDKKGLEVTDKKILEYIEKLVIPPAYNDVTVFYEASPKILFQGYDDKGRLQQIYSANHKKKAMKKKFCNVLEFGKVLPKIESDIKKYMNSEKFTKNKIISLIMKIIMKCGFRLGNIKYQKLYGSYGISNILKKHISKKDNYMIIKFIGKKGVLNECEIQDSEIIKEMDKLILKKKQNDPVFAYTLLGRENTITALEINKWLKEYNDNVTSKHFRTWDVNILFIEYMRNSSISECDPVKLTEAKRKKIVVGAMKLISGKVNNTPSICKKEYLHIDLLNLYLKHPRIFKKWFFGCNTPKTCFIKYLENFCK